MRRARQLAALAAALAFVALLAACEDPHKGEHCVRGHDVTLFIPVSHYCGKNCHITTIIPERSWHCDEWASDSPRPS